MTVSAAGGFVGTAQAQYGGSPGPVDVDASDLPGDGSESNPYEIANASELQAMEDDLDANYELVSDIDASNTAQFNNGNGFDPVGPSLDNPFTGSFDGTGYTITGLTVTRPGEDAVGLFGVVGLPGSPGTVTDVTLTEVTVTGNRSVGGVGGLVRGNFGGTIQNVTASGSVSGDSGVGGLVGSNDGTIRNTTTSGSVTGNRSVGGLVGSSTRGTIRNGMTSKRVNGTQEVGGLVGTNRGSIQDATASGSVTATGDRSGSAGGLAGYNTGGHTECKSLW